jgi:hypothetical protein
MIITVFLVHKNTQGTLSTQNNKLDCVAIIIQAMHSCVLICCGMFFVHIFEEVTFNNCCDLSLSQFCTGGLEENYSHLIIKRHSVYLKIMIAFSSSMSSISERNAVGKDCSYIDCGMILFIY